MTRLALGVLGLGLCWWMAFRQTPDLDGVEKRTQYRTALMFFYLGAFRWWLEMLGWL